MGHRMKSITLLVIESAPNSKSSPRERVVSLGTSQGSIDRIEAPANRAGAADFQTACGARRI